MNNVLCLHFSQSISLFVSRDIIQNADQQNFNCNYAVVSPFHLERTPQLKSTFSSYIMDTKVRKIPWNSENGNVIPNLLNLVAEAKKKLFSVDGEASVNSEQTTVPPVEKKRRWVSSLYMGFVILTCLLGAFICLRNFITW